MWRIRLRSPILRTYSRCSEDECLILILHSYSSVWLIFVTISLIEHFERSSVHNAFFQTYWFQNSLMTLAHLINMAFHLFIHHFCYCFSHFSGHLNGNNNNYLVICDVYVYAVPFLVRTVDVLKMNVWF